MGHIMKLLITFSCVLSLIGGAAWAYDSGVDTSAKVDVSFQYQTIKSFPSLKGTKKIALTIDDGPTEVVTDEMLNLLKSLKIKATFFMLGKQVQKNQKLTKRVSQEGHVIGNHTYDHRFFLIMNKETRKYDCSDDKFVYDEIRSTHDILKPFISPSQKRLYFRPPGGGWCARYAAVMNADPELQNYVGPLYWNMGGSMWYEQDGVSTSPILDAGDEECWTQKLPIARCLEGYRASTKRLKGGVLLVHDVHMESIEMLRILLPELLAQGYEFVTLDQVEDLKKYTAPKPLEI